VLARFLPAAAPVPIQRSYGCWMNPNTTLSGADGAPVLLLLAQEVRDQPHAHQGVHTHRWGVLQKLGAEAPA